MADRLKGKVALVTGGSTGIGQAIAVIFSREGAKVAISGRTKSTLETAAAEIAKEGGEICYIVGDVSQASDAERMVQATVAKFGKLDILVNNAGIRANIVNVLDLTEEEWHRTFDVDAKGSWLCSKYAIPEMQKIDGGSIIMITSISAYVGQPLQGAYNAAKAAQELLMKCMALDFAKDNIRVNSICPAWTFNAQSRDQFEQLMENPDKIYPPGISYNMLTKDMHPLGRIGTPEDSAWAAVYLASDESPWVTGSSLFVDGGYMSQ